MSTPSLASLRLLIPLALVTLAVPFAGGQTLTGQWQTPAGSVVDVHSCGSALCLSIAQIERSAPGTLDANNPDPKLRTRSLCDLEIGTGFQPASNHKSADDGTLYDPKSGRTYHGSMELDGNNRLKLRGYIGVKLFGRTEVWTRPTAPVTPCH